MKGINKVTLIGYVGADPEVRHTTDNKAMTAFSLATSSSWKDAKTGEKKEETEWHRLVFFGKIAEIIGEYVKKGSRLYVEGSLKTRKWTDKKGIERYTTEIMGKEMTMLDSKSSQDAVSEKETQPVKEKEHIDNDDGILFCLSDGTVWDGKR